MSYETLFPFVPCVSRSSQAQISYSRRKLWTTYSNLERDSLRSLNCERRKRAAAARFRVRREQAEEEEVIES
jgi:hypothetical protein